MAAAFPQAYPPCLSLAGFDACIAYFSLKKGATTAAVKELLRLHSPPLRSSAATALPTLAAHTGQPTAFISHSYSNDFVGMVDSIRAWEASARSDCVASHFYYFDLLVEYQQFDAPPPPVPVALPFEFLKSRFGAMVSAIRQTLLVLDWPAAGAQALLPAQAQGGQGGAAALVPHSPLVPRPLASAWCVFEIAMTVSQGVPFEVLMASSDRAALQRDVEADLRRLLDVMCAVDVRACRAQEARDKEGILAFVRGEFGEQGGDGCAAMNQRVNDALRAFVKKEGRLCLESIPTARRFTAPFARAYLSLIKEHGEYHNEAEERHGREVAGAIYSAYARPPPLHSPPSTPLTTPLPSLPSLSPSSSSGHHAPLPLPPSPQ